MFSAAAGTAVGWVPFEIPADGSAGPVGKREAHAAAVYCDFLM